jgi:hypothetical protein
MQGRTGEPNRTAESTAAERTVPNGSIKPPGSQRQRKRTTQGEQADWLTTLDSRVANLPPLDYVQAPYFCFARYAHLRKRHDASGFRVLVREAKAATAQLEGLGVLANLNEQQRFEVGALLFDIDAAYKESPQFSTLQRSLVAARNQGRGTARRLARKIVSVADALDELAKYCAQVYARWPVPAVEIFGTLPNPTALSNEAIQYRCTAQGILENADLLATTFRLRESYVPTSRTPRDLKSIATLQLTSYFMTSCALSRAEAEIRASKIGNLMWKWNDKIREKYEGETRFRGSEAARSRRRRARSSNRS